MVDAGVDAKLVAAAAARAERPARVRDDGRVGQLRQAASLAEGGDVAAFGQIALDPTQHVAGGGAGVRVAGELQRVDLGAGCVGSAMRRDLGSAAERRGDAKKSRDSNRPARGFPLPSYGPPATAGRGKGCGASANFGG
jgi:hypothetical protein